MNNITGDKGLYNKFVSLDGDWTKNKVHTFVLIVLISYFATKILYSAAYKIYSYESLENEVLSFGLLMILTGIIFLACQIGNRDVLGGKSGANWLFFFGMMLGVNLPMVYRQTMFKDTSGDHDTHYLLYTLVIIIVLLCIGLTFVSTDKKGQYALYSFVLLVIAITTIMARINKMPNEEGFTVDIYTKGDGNDKLKKEIEQNEIELKMLRHQLSSMQKNNSDNTKKLNDLQHNHNQLLGSHTALLRSGDANYCDNDPQAKNKRRGDIANYYMAAGAFGISLLLTSDSKDKAVNGFISIIQGILLGGVISGLAVGVLKRKNICSSNGVTVPTGPSSPGGPSGCKPYIYELNDTANSILYVTAGVLIIGSFGAAFYLGRGKGLIWSLGLFFITLPVIALVLYVMVLGARKKVKNPHCTSSSSSSSSSPSSPSTPSSPSSPSTPSTPNTPSTPSSGPTTAPINTHLWPGTSSEPVIPIPSGGGSCGSDLGINSFLDSVSFPSLSEINEDTGTPSTQSTPSTSNDCSCDNLSNCTGKQSTIKKEKYNPIYLILLINLSIISIIGGIHGTMSGNMIKMGIFLAVIPIVLSTIFLPLFFKDLHKKLIFHYNLKKSYTKCCKSGGTGTQCFPHMTISDTKTYVIFIGSAIVSILIAVSAYHIMKNSLILIGGATFAAMCIIVVVILKVVLNMNRKTLGSIGLDAYLGLTDLIVAKKKTDIESSDVSIYAGFGDSEKKITGNDFTINKKYISDLQSAVDSDNNDHLCNNLNKEGMVTMPKNVCKILYYKNKSSDPCLFTNYKHKGCGTFETCTYSGKSTKLGDINLNEGFITIYTCTRNSWKCGAGILTIVLVLFLIMFLITYFVNKQASRVKAT